METDDGLAVSLIKDETAYAAGCEASTRPLVLADDFRSVHNLLINFSHIESAWGWPRS